MKNKILPTLLALATSMILTLTAVAESDSAATTDQNVVPLIIITAAISVISIICVIIANKKSAKYRKAFKHKKRK